MIHRFLEQPLDCLAELVRIHQYNSNHRYCAGLLRQFSHLTLTRTIHFRWAVANLDAHNQQNYICDQKSKYNEHFLVLFFVWWTHSPTEKEFFTINFWFCNGWRDWITWGVSNETASIQCLRQMFLASNQSTSSVRVGKCSQLKKYEWATPRASLYVAWRTPQKMKT